QITTRFQHVQWLLSILFDLIPPLRSEGFSQARDLSARSHLRELQRRARASLHVLRRIDSAVAFSPPQFFDVSAQSVDDGDLASFPPNVQTFAPRLAFADDEMSGYPRGYPTAGQMLIFRPIDCSRHPANPRRPADYVIPGSPRQLGRNFGVVTKAQPVARR